MKEIVIEPSSDYSETYEYIKVENSETWATVFLCIF